MIDTAKLREIWKDCQRNQLHLDESLIGGVDLIEIADEIDRLKAENEHLTKLNSSIEPAFDYLVKDTHMLNKKLRIAMAALEENNGGVWCAADHKWVEVPTATRAIKEIKEIK